MPLDAAAPRNSTSATLVLWALSAVVALGCAGSSQTDGGANPGLADCPEDGGVTVVESGVPVRLKGCRGVSNQLLRLEGPALWVTDTFPGLGTANGSCSVNDVQFADGRFGFADGGAYIRPLDTFLVFRDVVDGGVAPLDVQFVGADADRSVTFTKRPLKRRGPGVPLLAVDAPFEEHLLLSDLNAYPYTFQAPRAGRLTLSIESSPLLGGARILVGQANVVETTGAVGTAGFDVAAGEVRIEVGPRLGGLPVLCRKPNLYVGDEGFLDPAYTVPLRIRATFQ